MKLFVRPAISLLQGNVEQLKKIHDFFSFEDKGARSEMLRFKESLKFKERSIRNEDGDLPEDYLQWKNFRLAELKAAITVYCCSLNDDSLDIPTGLLQSLLTYIEELSVAVSIVDERNFETNRRSLKGEKPNKLRRPQQEALDLILSTDTLPNKGMGLIRLATGVGKTALAQELIRKLGTRSIFLVPSLPILNQTVKRYEAAFGKKNVTAYGGGDKKVGYITVATYQSVYAGDPEDFKDVDLAVFDEAHHIAADTFYDVATVKLKNAVYRYGLTAFEERADGATQLIEAAVGPVIYTYDAPEAIEEGFLARPTFMIYDVWATEGSWTKYKTKDKKRVVDGIQTSVPYEGDDDIKAYRNWILGNNKLNSYVVGITNAMVDDGKSVLILVDEKEHGERLQALLPGSGFAIGGGKDNEQLQKDFNARKLKVLLGTSTLGEGADLVPVDVLINLQGGASKSKTLQSNGRALRNDPDPETGIPRKPNALIIDFNFPLNKYLKRQADAREQIHKALGTVHRGQIT